MELKLTGVATTTDMSHDGVSEIESAEDSEDKAQTTSDAESDKHSDSGEPFQH